MHPAKGFAQNQITTQRIDWNIIKNQLKKQEHLIHMGQMLLLFGNTFSSVLLHPSPKRSYAYYIKKRIRTI